MNDPFDCDEIIHQTLFACSKCGARHKFIDLSPEEQICRECRRKFPLKNCGYCQLEFYWMGDPSSVPLCKRCKRDQHIHGKPSICDYCQEKASFSGRYCFRCQYFEEKYGKPVGCNSCKLSCAFVKSEESRRKVSNQILCYLCTIKFKRNVHRESKKRALINVGPSSIESQAKRGSLSVSTKNDSNSLNTVEAKITSNSLAEFEPIPGLGNFTGQDLKNTKNIPSELPPETIEKWREDNANLRNMIQLKDNYIYEKEKHLQSLRTEMFEKEREYRQKMSQAQQDYDKTNNELQETINDLKKQVTQTSKTK